MLRHARTTVRSLATQDSGIALIAAIAILLIISLLASAAITTSLDTSSSTTKDESRKSALAAAEAGLRVASYRLTMLNPEERQCIGASANETPTGTYCAATEEEMGNGAAFSYKTTPALAAGEKCVGLEVQSQEALQQRCVTATGRAGGVSVRVEARVASFTAKPLFPYDKIGLIGLEEIRIAGNHLDLYNGLGSNGRITVEGNNIHQTGGCELGPSGKYTSSGNNFEACEPAPRQRTPAEGELVLSPVKPGNSESGPCPAEAEAEPSGNCDERIIEGMLRAEKRTYTSPYDSFSTANGYIPEMRAALERERVLLLRGNNISLTLTGGVYNFCSMIVEGNHNSITVAAGVKTEIFVGSPGCPSGTGQLNLRGNSLGSLSEQSTALQIYVYGNGPVNLEGNSEHSTAAIVYAPQAEVNIRGNSANFKGGIAARRLHIEGNSFTDGWQSEDQGVKVGKAGASDAYYRTAWGQCTPEGTTPAEGC